MAPRGPLRKVAAPSQLAARSRAFGLAEKSPAAKSTQAIKNKKACFYLFLFFRFGTYQRVTAISN
jgi:hypothetical protein